VAAIASLITVQQRFWSPSQSSSLQCEKNNLARITPIVETETVKAVKSSSLAMIGAAS
jgi:hypothetical protein